MKVYEALAEMLVAEGVETVFGLLGGGVDSLIHVLVERHGVQYVPVRHEEAAVGAADGYFRATGKIGVAIVAYGPGIAKTGGTLIAANMANSSVLLICGEVHDRLSPMNFEQHPFILATAGAIQTVRTPQTLAEDVQLAFRHLRLGKGPIVLNLTPSALEYDPPAGRSYDARGLSVVPASRPIPQPADIEMAADLLGRSVRPLILAGRGAVLAGAKQSLIALAERTGALLATTILAKDWFRGHPRNVGLAGGFSAPSARALLAEADLVIAFGTRFNQNTSAHGKLVPNATIVQIDTDPGRIGDITPVHHAVIADAGLTAAALVEASRQSRGAGWGGAAIERRVAALDQWEGLDLTETPGSMNPHLAMRIADELLPQPRQLVVDIGDFMGAPATHISVTDPRDLVFPWQLGMMGTGLSVAIGAAVAKPDRRTVLFCGDGGLMASLNDLDTAARCAVPLTVIVMDDSGFGAERRIFRANRLTETMADYPSPDMAATARALGLEGYRVNDSESFGQALRAINTHGRPSLVQVKVSRDARSDEMARYRGR